MPAPSGNGGGSPAVSAIGLAVPAVPIASPLFPHRKVPPMILDTDLQDALDVLARLETQAAALDGAGLAVEIHVTIDIDVRLVTGKDNGG
jgi:hypothetical protein